MHPIAGIDATTINAIEHLITTVVNAFGPGKTILLMIAIAVAVFVWRVYNNYRKDKEINKAIQALEQSVQRCAAEAREWRIVFLKKDGWSDTEIDRFILKGQFDSAAEAREALERGASAMEHQPSPNPSHKTKRKGRR